MVVGHYAAALIPHARQPRTPVWLFLLAANVSDFIWLVLAFAGLEAPRPASMFAASYSNLVVGMPYSHDLVPALGLALAIGVLSVLLTRSATAAGWCAALVVIHELCDFISGFEHRLLGPGTKRVGLDLYHRSPELALVLEAAFGAVCTWWFVRYRAS